MVTKATIQSLRDYVSYEDEPDEEYRILRKMKTKFQRLAVVKLNNGKVLIYGNGYVMFGTTEDDNVWAEAMVHIPMNAAKKRQNILMIGGGGGITTREVLRYRDVKSVTVVDIDAEMMKLGKKLKPLMKFNKGSLNNPKVKTVIQDGRAFLEDNRKKWDAIIIDVPEPSHDAPALRRLFSKEFYTLIKKRLAPGGVLMQACSVLSVMPEYHSAIAATMKAAGLYVKPFHYDVMKKYGEDWAYCVAAAKPLKAKNIKISLPTRYVTGARLKKMFGIPAKYRRKWRQGEGKIQTDSNKVLETIHERH